MTSIISGVDDLELQAYLLLHVKNILEKRHEIQGEVIDEPDP